MHPTVFGSSAYLAAIAAAVVAGTFFTLFLGRRRGIPWGTLVKAVGGVSLAGILGAKTYSIFEAAARGALSFSMLGEGGFRYPGGILAVILILPLIVRRVRPYVSALALVDIMAPGAAIAMAVVRVGCLLQGCCYGRVSTLPWAIRFPLNSPAWNDQLVMGLIPANAASSLPVHPLEVYFGAWSLAVAITLLVVSRRQRYDGQIGLLFLLLHEGGKGLLESLRGPFPLWYLQVPSLTLGALAAVLLVRFRSVGNVRLRPHVGSEARLAPTTTGPPSAHGV